MPSWGVRSGMTVHAAGSSMRCMGHLMCRSLDWGEDVCPGNTERTDDYVQAACAWFYDGFRYQKVIPGTFRALMNRIPYLKKTRCEQQLNLCRCMSLRKLNCQSSRNFRIYPLERKTDGSDPSGRKNKRGSEQSELLGI